MQVHTEEIHIGLVGLDNLGLGMQEVVVQVQFDLGVQVQIDLLEEHKNIHSTHVDSSCEKKQFQHLELIQVMNVTDPESMCNSGPVTQKESGVEMS